MKVKELKRLLNELDDDGYISFVSWIDDNFNGYVCSVDDFSDWVVNSGSDGVPGYYIYSQEWKDDHINQLV